VARTPNEQRADTDTVTFPRSVSIILSVPELLPALPLTPLLQAKRGQEGAGTISWIRVNMTSFTLKDQLSESREVEEMIQKHI
jgi:hypothetical protein